MNLVTGDYVEFQLPQYTGGTFSSWGRSRTSRGATYVGDQAYEGTIEREWYDIYHRHWFSVRLTNRKIKRVQGRNLYPRVTLHHPGLDHALSATAKAEAKRVTV
jgi:hypothetical protein